MAVLARARIGRGVSAQGFYAQRLRFRDLAFDIGASAGEHTAAMLKRGARVVAVEPQADLARRLGHDFPAATVRAVGVSDQPGEATLITSSDFDQVATLNPAFQDTFHGFAWDGEESIRLTTLDDLIAEFGLPAFVKIDTEGLEDKVLAGLSQPLGQFLFEVHAEMPDVAARAFERLAALGTYEYRLMRQSEPWVLGPPVSATAILADLPAFPDLGDVWARQVYLDY
jgi:FkbM family methyltransferase